MHDDEYVFQLEQLLDFFEPDPTTYSGYTLENEDTRVVFVVNNGLADAVDHANEILYGDSFNDD